MPLLGRTIANKYHLEARLGRGGMSSVYRAQQTTLQRAVAIKVLHHHLAEDEGFIGRFEREAASIAQLRHPNIVQVFDFDHDPELDINYMVMELIEGTTLRDEIERHQQEASEFTPLELLRIIRAVASALDFAHSLDMIHRDVKPANIMFTKRGQVVLADFGLARPLGESNLSQVGMIAGTPHYMSPEQAQGQPLDGRTDIYSLGIVLYEMATLHLPFAGQNTPLILFQHISEPPPRPSQVAPHISADLEEVIFTALAKEPEERYPTAAALAEAVREALQISATDWLSTIAPGVSVASSVATGITANTPLPASPYRGLYAFQEEDAPYFFGRERAIETLYGQLTTQPLVGLLGASGSGKSSVVLAGLLPRLRASAGRAQGPPLPHGDGHWTILSLRPGARPLASLATALTHQLAPADTTAEELLRQSKKLAEALLVGDLLLRDILERLPSPLLLILDQFEELFTLVHDPAERQQFLAHLLGAASVADKRHILLTLRADFLGPALEYRPLADALQSGLVVLGPMSREELQRAIEKPAHKQRVSFEDGLVERILDDVGREPGNLPLLEFALTTLWERQAAGQLTHATYEAIGRVEGALTSYADGVLAGLNVAEQARARAIFTQMVRPGEGTEDTRRVASRTEIGTEHWPLVQKLADHRLIVTNRDPEGQETAEVVHEALIRTWGQLRGWMQADRTFRAWQERLRAALRQWQESGRDDGALLRGVPLAEAEGWLAERSAALNTAEAQFIHASLAARDAEQAQRQREQRTRERLRLALTLVAVVGLFVTGGLAVWALGQRNEALTARAIAQEAQATAVAERDLLEISFSQQLAIQSGLALESDLSLALLLAVEAYQTAPTTEAQGSLLDALLAKPALVRYLYGHTDRVQAVAMSGDGRWLASAGSDTTILLRHPSDPSAPPVLLEGHTSIINALAFSPDGRWLVSAGNDRQVVVWDLAQEPPLPQPLVGGHTNLVLALAYDPQGDYLASADGNGQVILWETNTWRNAAVLPAQEGSLFALAFSPDGQQLAMAGERGQVMVWDVATQHAIHPTGWAGATQALATLAFSPDGQWLVGGGRDNSVLVWQTATGQLETTLTGHANWVTSLAFAPEGALLASADREGSIRWWRTADWAVLEPLTTNHPAWVSSLAFSGDGAQLASASHDGSVVLWQTPPVRGNLVPPLIASAQRAHTDWALDAAYSPDGQWLATAGRDGQVLVWATGNWAEPVAQVAHGAAVRAVAFSPDSRLLAYGSEDGTVNLWEVASQRPLGQPWLGHTDFVQSLAFSPDGQWLASVGDDQSARVWEVATGELRHTLLAHSGTVWDVAFSPDGALLVTGGRDGLVIVWQTANFSRRGEPLRHSVGVRGLSFSPDGARVATASDDQLVRVWNVATGELEGTLAGHTAEVESVNFSPDGRWLVSVGDDQGVLVWDWARGRPLSQLGWPLRGHTDWVFQAVFSPASDEIASVGRDGQVVVWEFSAEGWVGQACGRANRGLNAAEWQRFFGGEFVGGRC